MKVEGWGYKSVLYYCQLLAIGDELFCCAVVVGQRFEQVGKSLRNTIFLANSFLHSSQIINSWIRSREKKYEVHDILKHIVQFLCILARDLQSTIEIA